VLDPESYERECECDWTVGAFMLARREALYSGGFMDERFFLYSDEPDLCLRLKRAGWRVMHSPAMTIVHHAGKAGVKPRLTAQEALARRLYAEKHFGLPHRLLYIGALVLRYGLRGTGQRDPARRSAARRGLLTLLGLGEPPFEAPPKTSVRGGDLSAERRAPSPVPGGAGVKGQRAGRA
jgi:GT2 family glycosyltransferase